MGRRLMLGMLVLALAAAFGCGGAAKNEALKNARPAKPVDIGDPTSIAMGITAFPPSCFIVKTVVEGETRIWAVSDRIPGPNPAPISWDPQTNIFADGGRAHRYEITGQALHKVGKGANADQPGMSLKRFKVELDKSNGHVLLSTFLPLAKEDWGDTTKGAYVVVP